MYIFVKKTSVVRITNRIEEIHPGIPKLISANGTATFKPHPQIGQSQPNKQIPVSGPICNHRDSGQASINKAGGE